LDIKTIRAQFLENGYKLGAVEAACKRIDKRGSA